MDFEVNRLDFRETRVVEEPSPDLAAGQVRMAVERFAVTTNNVTYAVAGDMLDYWGFFPTEAPWGRVPAMGLGSVVESRNDDVALGGRYFGFYSMSGEIVIDARKRGNSFRDVGTHRADHAPIYTDFLPVADDAMFREDKADEYLLFRGLFLTSFLVDDYLADNDFQGATQTLVTSASSKTSISLAVCLSNRADHKSIGLTSERNRSFVDGLGLYDQVLTYDELDQLDPSISTGLVDMAGNGTLRADVHNTFGENLKFSLTVGATHWEDQGGGGKLPGPTPEFFFAPSQSVKRIAEWGQGELDRRIGTSFDRLLESAESWLDVQHKTGAEGITSVYEDLLEGRAAPSVGYTVSL